MTSNILTENQNKRLTIPLRLLFCFALYSAWQMGVIFFSGLALSIDGRTPLPVTIDNMTTLVVTGYLCSIVFTMALPHFVVWAERISALIALLASLAIFLPLPPVFLAALIYIQAFFCVFMIGFENAIIVNLFTEKTAIWHLLAAYSLSETLIAILQNDIIKIPYSVFGGFTIIALAFMLCFFFKLPGNLWPQFVRKKDGLIHPKRYFAGIYLLVFLGGIMTLFGSAVAETMVHGVSIYYLSVAGFSVLVFFLWKKFGIHPIRSSTGLVVVAALGFIATFLSLYFPFLLPMACVMTSAGMTALSLAPLLGLMMAKRYPSRFISPVLIGLAMSSVLLQSAILEFFRDAPATLYIIYLVIAVVMAILFLALEPYLIYSFRKEEHPEVMSAPVETYDRSTDEIRQTASDESDIEKVLNHHAFDKLSGQEWRLAELILQGYTNGEIAMTLALTLGTVKVYRKNLYSKLQIHSKRELFEMANAKK